MSNLTDRGAVLEYKAGQTTGTESRLGGAGSTKRLMKDATDGVATNPTGTRLTARGDKIARALAS